MLTAEVKQALTPATTGITLIITVGNTLRSDDGVGPYIAEGCSRLKAGLALLDVGDKPENGIDQAVNSKASKVVFIDAADFGGHVGEARLVPKEQIPQTSLSTHTFPLPVIAKMIEEDAKAKVLFLGIQPAKVELGEGLNKKVRATGDEIIALLKE
ncbi:MAG: hydrogenase 3 maturation endopeptidase HyCI [Candidatus Saganbacteria bacterium]|nr:hydrogenase 3 maturation endopeptidase HyCI [Candidatus Saganbacteria bacterium]